ncbi:DUF421 domain-containing protein [Sphingobacterium paludis]|uniref:Uncharacterized protein DUF421 n=1 Tax=Sphingobacterium paludis TaxID=1476465 RepID=A0A4R7CUD2_9SPHI|nr:YetF domain-containing protein [Sphingobacterium paludis]TDS06787.1 uncharacterized protein DUF421 [Sphingobacterium paludis]
MKFDEIYFGDTARLLFGEVPPSFFLEVIVRVAFIYLIIVFSVRLIGRRMNSMLSKVELAAMVSLAGAVGVPLQAPDRGLLPVIIIALVIVFFERISSWLSTESPLVEKVTTGDITTLIQDGVVNLQGLKKVNISRQRLFAELRSEGICHLGSVQRCYIEANGTFSLKLRDEALPGLSILPEWDKELAEELKSEDDSEVCSMCGVARNASKSCDGCGANSWLPTII